MKRSTVKKYLATIDSIKRRGGKVSTSEVAECLEVTAPSVSETFRKLSEEGYIRWRPYSGVKLTEKGKAAASSVERNRRVLTDFLMGIGVREDIAREQAALMELEVSNETVERVQDLLKWV